MKLKLDSRKELLSSDPQNLIECYFGMRKLEAEHARGGCKVCKERIKQMEKEVKACKN